MRLLVVSSTFAVLLLFLAEGESAPQAHGLKHDFVAAQQSLSAQEATPRLAMSTQHAWVKEDYPNPEASPSECRTTSNRLCDPDGVLIDVERNKLIQKIQQLESHHFVTCPNREQKKEPIQMAVALANRLDLVPYGPYEDREEKAAKDFAIHIHNDWGVGVEAECGGTGLLFFLSVLDRSLYVSRGRALEAILTDRRLDRAIDRIKPFLRNQDYAKAALNMMEELGKYLDKGPPSTEERRQDMLETLIPLSFFATILGCAFLKSRSERREARAYAQLESQLSQLDRDRAEALRGKYQCTSCPICLENFADPVKGEEHSSKGSDGLPLKLLRCGHVFDETCWSEWISGGSGNVTRCPICQQDVGTSSPTPTTITDRQHDQDRVFRQFNRERNFRLMRLAMQFPRYVRQEQIHRWTQSTYEGQLARDPSFVRSNPRYRTSQSSSGTSFRSGGFGGGSSGGGRGGRW
jgi:uncharacterized membrane protein YgcG